MATVIDAVQGEINTAIDEMIEQVDDVLSSIAQNAGSISNEEFVHILKHVLANTTIKDRIVEQVEDW